MAESQQVLDDVVQNEYKYGFESAIEQELLEKIDELNNDPEIHGILVQLPLPAQIDEFKIITAIAPEKDVDGFHPISVGNMMIGKEAFLPCTPHGVMVLLEHYGIDPAGKHAVVIGRSNIVGKPVGQLLLQKDATVTYCHSKTPDLKAMTYQADIIIAAIGRAKFIGADHIKKDAVVIDVGMNRDENGKLCGDVEYAAAAERSAWITPVPGGVGPMTIAMLMVNTLTAARRLAGNQSDVRRQTVLPPDAWSIASRRASCAAISSRDAATTLSASWARSIRRIWLAPVPAPAVATCAATRWGSG